MPTTCCRFMPSRSWTSDEQATVCAVSSCCKLFTMLERKHHCRMCGQVVCNACTKYVTVFVNGPEPVRCCSTCIASANPSAGPREILLALCREVALPIFLCCMKLLMLFHSGAQHSPRGRAPLPTHQSHRRQNPTTSWRHPYSLQHSELRSDCSSPWVMLPLMF